jgi:hypothetical protein
VIPATRPVPPVWRRQQRVNFLSAQEWHQGAGKPFGRNGQHALDLRRVSRCLEGRESEERVHGRQPQVARAGGDAARLLHLVEEGHHQRRVNVVQCQCRGCLAQALVHELQQHLEGVAVRGNRVRTGLPLLHQALGEESLQKNTEVGLTAHDDSPQRRSSRAMAWAISSGLLLRYQ